MFIDKLNSMANTVSNPSVALDSMLNSMISQLDK